MTSRWSRWLIFDTVNDLESRKITVKQAQARRDLCELLEETVGQGHNAGHRLVHRTLNAS